MSDQLRLLLAASLNVGKSVGDINSAIRALENHPSLQKIKLKIDIDTSFISKFNDLTNRINRISQASQLQGKITDSVTSKIKNETDAINSQTKAVENLMRVQEKYNGNKEKVGQSITTGTRYQSVTEHQIINPDKTIVTSGYTSNFNAEKERNDAEKLANQIADGRIKAQERWQKQQESQRKKEIDDAHREAKEQNDLANQMAEFRIKSEERVRNFNRQWEVNQQNQIQKNAEIERQEISSNQKNRQEYMDWWKGALNAQEQKEVQLREKVLQEETKIRASIQKTVNTEEEKNKRLEHQLELYKQQATINVQNLHRRFGDSVDNSAIEQYLKSVNSLSATTPNLKREMDKLSMSFKEIGANAQTSGSHVMGMGEALKIALARFPVWMLATTAFYAPLRAIESGIKTIYGLDTAMTDLQKVTDETSNTYAKFVVNASQTANQIGALTLDVVKSTTEWARLGYTLQQAQQLAKQTTVYQNVGDIKNSEQASTDLISAIKGFNIEVDAQGKNVEHLVDVYNEVGNKFSISSAGIGAAAKRGASALHEAGNTMEQAVALITAANSAVQDPAKVGNALKTISLRLRGVSEDGEDVSNLLPTLEKYFKSIGLTLKKDDFTFKSTYEIFNDLSKVWNTLNGLQKSDFLEMIAGKEQANVASSLITNWKDAQGALEAGLNSFGSAAKENAKYLESLQGRIAVFKNSVSTLWVNTINSDTVKGIVDFGTTLITTLTKVSNSIGSIPTTIGLISSVILLLSSNTRAFIAGSGTQMLTWLGLTQTQLNVSTIAIHRFSVGLGLGTTAARALTVSLVGLSRAFLPLAAISAVTYAIGALSDSYSKNKEAQKSLEERNAKVVDSWTTQRSTVEALKNEYLQLYEATNNGKSFVDSEQQQKYLEVSNKLSELMPNLTKYIDDKGQAHLKSAEAIQKEIENTQKLVDAEQKRKLASSNDNFKDLLKQKSEIQSQLDLAQNQIKYGTRLGVSNLSASKLSESEIAAVEVRLLGLQSQIADTNSQIKEQIISLTTVATNLSGVKISDNISKELKSIVNSMNVGNLKPEELTAKVGVLTTLIQKLNTIKELRAGTSPDAMDSAAAEERQFYALAQAAGLTEKQIQSLTDSMFKLSTTTQQSAFNAKGFQKEITDLYQKSAERVRPLNDAIDKLAQGHELTSSEIASLIKQYPDLFTAFTEENGHIKVNMEALKEKQKTELAEIQDSINGQRAKVEAQKSALADKLSAYADEIKAIKSSAQAKQLEAKIFREAEEQMHKDGVQGAPWIKKDDMDALEAIGAAEEAIRSLQSQKDKGFSFINSSNNPNNSTSAPSVPTVEDVSLQKESLALARSQYEVSKQNIDLLDKRAKNAEKEKDYQSAIETTNKLLDTQKQALLDLDVAQKQVSNDADTIRNDTRYSALGQMFSDNGVKFDAWFDSQGNASKVYLEYVKKLQTEQYNLLQGKDKLNKSEQTYNDSLTEQIKTAKQVFEALQVQKKGYVELTQTQNTLAEAINATVESLDKLKLDKITNQIEESKAAMEDQGGSELEITKSVFEQWKNINNERLDYSKAIQDVTKKNLDASEAAYKKSELTNSEQWIQDETDRMTMAKATETQIAQMVYDARKRMSEESWTAERGLSKLTAQEQLKADKARYDAQKRLVDLQEQSQKKLNDNTRDIINKLKDASDEYYDGLLKAEDKRHEKVTENLDKELKQYEDSVNTILQSMDRESATEDYNSNLAKLQKEAQNIEDLRAKYALDDSVESKAKLKDLDKEYADKQTEIQKLQNDRTKELRKDSLQDLLDKKKKEVDAAKDAEDQTNKALKESLEEQRLAAENHWNEILNDDKKFAQFQSDLVSGHFENITKQMESFKTNIVSKAGVIGNALTDSITNKLKDTMTTVQNFVKNPYGDSSNNYIPNSTTNTSTSLYKASNSEQQAIDQMKVNSAAWSKADAARKKELEDANQTIGYTIGATYKNGTWYKNDLPLYHDGGVIGSSSAAGNWLHKLLNLGQGEIPLIGKSGELVLSNPVNAISNLLNSIKMPDFSSITPKIASAGGDTNYQLTLNIASLTGDKAGGQTVFNEIVSGLKKLGK